MFESYESGRRMIEEATRLHSKIRRKRCEYSTRGAKGKRLARIDRMAIERMTRRLKAFDAQFPITVAERVAYLTR